MIAEARDLERFFEDRFGAVPGMEKGALHVAAVWRPAGGDRNVVLRISDQTPSSEVDFLLLNLARARAEAIVTTGRILHEEPGVVHDLQGPAPVRAALEVLAVCVEEGSLEQSAWIAPIEEAMGGGLVAHAKLVEFTGKAEQLLDVSTLGRTKARRIVLVGLGPRGHALQIGGAEQVHGLVAEAGRGVEDGQRFQPPGAQADLLFHLPARRVLNGLAGIEAAGWPVKLTK